ncbi:hypothetical protein [Kitasatospora sp. NPDC004289]
MGRAPIGLLAASASLQSRLEELAGGVFGPQLEALGLGVGQIESQGLEELEASLERVNDAIAHPEAFGTYRVRVSAEAGVVIAKSDAESHVTVGVLPLLLQRKKLVLDRIKVMRPQEQLVSVRRDVLENVVDGDLKEQVLGMIDGRLAAEREVSEQLEQESRAVDRAAAARAAEMRLDVELRARRSEIYKSLLERETVAGAVGPVLMFLLAGSLIVAMFTHTPITTAVSDSFLLILGYFFGQATGRRAERPRGEAPEAAGSAE